MTREFERTFSTPLLMPRLLFQPSLPSTEMKCKQTKSIKSKLTFVHGRSLKHKNPFLDNADFDPSGSIPFFFLMIAPLAQGAVRKIYDERTFTDVMLTECWGIQWVRGEKTKTRSSLHFQDCQKEKKMCKKKFSFFLYYLSVVLIEITFIQRQSKCNASFANKFMLQFKDP